MSARSLRPRASEALIVQPAAVSDRTSAAVLGLDARPYREFLVREQVPFARVGRRVVARLDLVLAALDRVAAREGEGESDVPAAPSSGVDRILALVGRERAAGGDR